MTESLIIVDGNNWFRRRAESFITGNPIRNCFYELHNQPRKVICVWDGAYGLKKRREIYPDYKISRKPAGEDIYKSQNMLKNVLDLSKINQIEVTGYEGDDVIACVHSMYKKSGASIFVESNDLDLYQLGSPMARDKFPEKPEWVRLYKTMVGDPSDNIPGCKSFGKTSWESLGDKEKTILEFVIVSGWGLTKDEVADKVKDFFPSRSLSWFLEPENRKQLLLFYKIVGFIHVEDELIIKNLRIGLNRPDLAENIFKEFML